MLSSVLVYKLHKGLDFLSPESPNTFVILRTNRFYFSGPSIFHYMQLISSLIKNSITGTPLPQLWLRPKMSLHTWESHPRWMIWLAELHPTRWTQRLSSRACQRTSWDWLSKSYWHLMYWAPLPSKEKSVTFQNTGSHNQQIFVENLLKCQSLETHTWTVFSRSSILVTQLSEINPFHRYMSPGSKAVGLVFSEVLWTAVTNASTENQNLKSWQRTMHWRRLFPPVHPQQWVSSWLSTVRKLIQHISHGCLGKFTNKT